jgi:hypothetical protein
MRRSVVVATFVVVAGCSAVPFGAGGQQATPADTVTPVPLTDSGVAETETTTVTDRPPGVRADGSVDAESLARTHVALIENRSYTWVVEYDTGRLDSVGAKTVRRAVVGDDTFFVEQTNPVMVSNTSLYVNETGGFLRVASGRETEYDLLQAPGDPAEYAFAEDAIRRFLGGITVDVTTVDRDGQRYYRLYVSGGPVPPALTESGATIRNYTATAYVTAEGFVRSMAVDYDRVVSGNRSTVTFRYDYSRLGDSDPPEPEWVGDVPRRSTPAPSNPGTTTNESTGTPDGSETSTVQTDGSTTQTDE